MQKYATRGHDDNNIATASKSRNVPNRADDRKTPRSTNRARCQTQRVVSRDAP